MGAVNGVSGGGCVCLRLPCLVQTQAVCRMNSVVISLFFVPFLFGCRLA